MKKIVGFIAKEALRVFPALLFFFFSFNLINLTEDLMMSEKLIQRESFLVILLAAGAVAKILLVIDHFPVISLFKKKPLIYGVLWKTFVYSTTSLLIRYLTRLYPFVEFSGYKVDYLAFEETIFWPRFWAIHIWYVLLFFVFVISREIISIIGKERLKNIFFGK